MSYPGYVFTAKDPRTISRNGAALAPTASLKDVIAWGRRNSARVFTKVYARTITPEIQRLNAEGLTPKEIAVRVGLSYQRVSVILQRMNRDSAA